MRLEFAYYALNFVLGANATSSLTLKFVQVHTEFA